MNRNQKIALGCGGGGCLLVVLAVLAVGALIATGYIKAPGLTSYTDTDDNSNTNSNSNSNYNRNSNTNSNTNTTDTSSTMSDDDKHKLFQAGASSQDAELNRKVWDKLGFLKADGTPNDKYVAFLKEHVVWLFRNSEFMQTINPPAKAREYVNEHIDD